MTLIKVIDPYGNTAARFIEAGPAECKAQALADAREYAYEGCKIERWKPYQYQPDKKLAEIPLTPAADE